MIAKVILTNATAHSLGREFDYSVPPELEAKAVVGMRVLVPYGVRN